MKAGQVCSTPVHVTDWMPTLLAAAESDADTPVCDALNLLPLLHGETLPERPLYFHMPLYDLRWAATPCAVIRERDWKLVEHLGDSFDASLRYQTGRKVELFNLRDDLSESRDLSTVEKARAEAMSAKLHAWLKSIPAPIPAENPHFDANRQFEETKTKQAWNR